MADWVVATESQNRVVGMGLRNSSHFWDSSLMQYTLPTRSKFVAPNCDEILFEVSHCKAPQGVGREMTPFIPEWVVLKDQIFISSPTDSPSHIDSLPN